MINQSSLLVEEIKMKRSTVVLLLGLLFPNLVSASEEAARAQSQEVQCHALITEAECRSHQDLLARLPAGAERDAYLRQYAVMLDERVRLCACSMARNGYGVLRYR